jgi:uncharacterized membrane protein YjjP (DUF1212 family)
MFDLMKTRFVRLLVIVFIAVASLGSTLLISSGGFIDMRAAGVGK